MEHTDYQRIGRTRKVHGTRGELKVEIEDRWLEDFTQGDVVFLELQGQLVPYFVEELRGGSGLLLKLEEVDGREAALRLTSKPLYLRATDLLADDQREFYAEEVSLQYTYLIGYQLVDETTGPVGPIREVLDMPQQEMAVVDYRDGQSLVPLAEPLIERIDEATQTVHMRLPEGLLDLQR